MELTTTKSTGLLQLSPIEINEDYRKKWNIHGNDFVLLSIGGEPIRNTLYRIGGVGKFNPKEDYNLLIKYEEAYYEDSILKMCKSNDPKHLNGRWCIIDRQGNEKFVQPERSIDYPTLVKDSILYSFKGVYLNIETGEMYGSTRNALESGEYLFCKTDYYDKEREGILKVNKKTGTWELFPAK